MTFSNVAFVNCSFDDTVSENSNYKNTYFIGCHYHNLIEKGENDTDTMHEFPFCDIQPSPCEDGTVHHSADVNEQEMQNELDRHEEEGLLEEVAQDTSKMFENSEYLPTGAPFSECTFENVVFDVAVANMQFANCTFINVLFTKMVKNVLFEGCNINFSSEQMKEVFTACSYVASEEKRNETAENIICGEPRTKELTEDEKQALIKEEVEKRVGEERKTAYDEGMKAGKESVQQESENSSMEDLVKSIRNLAECVSEGMLDVVNEVSSLVEKEADKHKTIEKEVVRELTEEEIKDMVLRYIHDNINQVGELITSAQNYKSKETKESEESELEQGLGVL